MKTPQRSFVVEFKSGRRQPKARTNSIWGDADLKALAREVEDKVPHLFNSDEAPGMPEAGGAAPTDPINAGSASDTAGDLSVAQAAVASADDAEVEVAKQHEADCPAAEAVAQVQDSQQVSQPRTTSRRMPRKRVNRPTTNAIAHSSMTALEDESEQPKTAADPISLDEVAALDAENKRLKRLLAEQLQAQNLQLKKMLERFDVT
jgi:hypothetical protein